MELAARKCLFRRCGRGIVSVLLLSFVVPGSVTLLPDRPLYGETKDPGEKLFEVHCSACHPLDPPPVKAPPARGIVMHYRSRYGDYNSFEKAIVDYVRSPSPEASLMPEAIQRFGPMPPLMLEEGRLKRIARWMWRAFPGGPGRSPGGMR